MRICFRSFFLLLYVVCVFQGDKFFDVRFYPRRNEGESDKSRQQNISFHARCSTKIPQRYSSRGLSRSTARRRISQEAARKSHRKSDEEILEIKGLMKEMLERYQNGSTAVMDFPRAIMYFRDRLVEEQFQMVKILVREDKMCFLRRCVFYCNIVEVRGDN